CITFPIHNQELCTNDTATNGCNIQDPNVCEVRELSEMNETNAIGTYTLIEFPSCNPHYCFIGSCFQSRDNQLLPTDITDIQMGRSIDKICLPMCILPALQSTINVPTIPNGFISSTVINKSGNENIPCIPEFTPTRYILSIVQDLYIPFSIS